METKELHKFAQNSLHALMKNAKLNAIHNLPSHNSLKKSAS